ncbi:hypothetical protein FE257_003512 [Aspergillus nanangensis]|uniref:DUF3835 domain-containing protein n=1 Tax=Aspergillus nanangensis TaxID=2582783 RepID=A0AAD4CBG0_ASPNN|nr:hypothetical protein FE257_003512 [Aspergillus nanangensis]
MGVPNSDLHDLERQRLELENNVHKLQESLYHWRTWEAEYDGLKDQINDLDDDVTTVDMLQAGRELDGTLVNEDEVKAILGNKEGMTRSKEQVVNIISRRIDYVLQNVSTMEKKLLTEESKIHELDALEQIPTEPTADFPMTEIFEELDEEGNILSSSTTTPGNEAAELLNILKRAGVQDIPNTPRTENQIDSKDDTTHSVGQQPTTSPIQTAASESSEQSRVQDHNNKPTSSTNDTPEERPVVDVDESLEDAQLRREMLQYGLDEVGAVVAELELDEEASDISCDDYDDVYNYDEDDDAEDEFGRSTGSVLDNDYHREMRELEAKLNARGMWNMGKDTTTLPEEVKDELERPSVVRIEKDGETIERTPTTKKPKKKVAFAEELDIAPSPNSQDLKKKVVPVRQAETPVVSDSIVERADSAGKATSANDAPKKASRFKTARKVADSSASEPSTTLAPSSDNTIQSTELRSSLRKPNKAPLPSSLPLFPAKPDEPKPFSQPIQDLSEESSTPAPKGPEGKIFADTLVEREIPEGTAAPPEPDVLDEQLHRREIASEFYRMRNRMIQQNGGFLEEPEMVPIETEEAPKRVSKFRAARMR